jgi:excisionase family DNA binding protein
MPKADYMTTAELAKLLKLSTSTVTRLAREGVLPGLKVGRLWRFPEQDTQVRLYKQWQKQSDAANPDQQKNGWSSFLKLATNIGYVEPVRHP